MEIWVHQDKNFKGIFFQDLQMQKVYEKFPEILLVDATYKLLELRMPIYLLIAIDGDGQSEIVALFISADESKPTVTEVVQVFQKHNSCWTDTKVVMSDKDFIERDAFAACFPGAVLLICFVPYVRILVDCFYTVLYKINFVRTQGTDLAKK